MSPKEDRTTRGPLSFFKARRTRVAALTVTAALAGTALFGVGQATAGLQPKADRPATSPTTDRDIPNIDKVKEKIADYYGDIETPDGEHYASPK
ncbi:MAG TPA: hypothetical protein VGO89_06735, partial [Streptomyces sp.]|nr:hypothetical protein [Streptomyces sp.]